MADGKNFSNNSLLFVIKEEKYENVSVTNNAVKCEMFKCPWKEGR